VRLNNVAAKRPSVDDALAVLFSPAQRKRLNSLARPAFGKWIPRIALLNEALADLFSKYARADGSQRASEGEQTEASELDGSALRKHLGQQTLLAERFECGRIDAPNAGLFGPQNRFELRAVDEWRNSEYILRQRRSSGGNHYVQMNMDEARLFKKRQGGIDERRKRLQELHPDKLGRDQTPQEREEYVALVKQLKRRQRR
jgi:hypothetical protein